jgi:RND family efflux transporter MFP subunit
MLIQATVIGVRTAQIPVRIEVTGRVVAVTQATLASKVQGMVEEVLVREGSVVSKGQVLILLDSRDLRAELARAEAEFENARLQLNRMEGLFAEDAVSKQELENAIRAFKVAEAAKKAVLAQLSYTVIRAPFAGVITEKKVEAGELASPGQPLLRVEDPRQLRLEATVAERDLKAISRGDKIPVIIDALDSTPLQGVVAQILPSGDPETHTFLVKVDLPKTDGLKSGMFGRMLLDKGLSDTMVILRSALVERGELTGVYVVGPDTVAHLRWVKIGRTVGNEVEVLSGLNIGERVLADAAKGVEGARVQIVMRDG